MKRLSLTILAGLVLTLAFSFTTMQPAYAQKKIENPDIVVGVDGLACPFCAYGLEKKVKKLEGIDDIYINIDEGRMDLKLKQGATLSEETIKKAVRDAGFTMRSIRYANKKARPDTTVDGSESALYEKEERQSEKYQNHT